jgi:hypothetical protein
MAWTETELNQNSGWMTLDGELLPFHFWSGKLPELIRRKIYAYGQWEKLSEITIRFVYIGTSEIRMEKSISVRQEMSESNGERVAPRTGKARLRLKLVSQKANMCEMIRRPCIYVI